MIVVVVGIVAPVAVRVGVIHIGMIRIEMIDHHVVVVVFVGVVVADHIEHNGPYQLTI